MLSVTERAGGLRRLFSRLFRRLKPGRRPGEVDPAELKRQKVMALRPIVRGLCGVVGSYYILIFVAHFFYETGIALPVLTTLSAVTALTCWAFFIWTRGTEAMGRLEIASLVVNLLMYANVVTYQGLHFEPAKLIYFVLLTLVYATSAASLRVVLPTCCLAVVTMYIMASGAGFPVLKQHIWVGIAGITTAFGMAGIMRSTIFRAVHARVLAEKHRHEAQVLAHYDALTTLPNRRSFFTELEVAMVGAQRGHPFDLALIDLDGFKPVNDLYGHSVGDALLIEVGSRLRAVVGTRGVVARLGGDEFALILNRQHTDDDLRRFGEDLCDALRQTYVLGGGVNANISGSVGFVHSDPAGQWTASQMLERADYALYYAKQNLRGAPVIFDARHENEMQDFGAVDQTLRSSDLERELYIVFQPQIDLKAQRTVSFEALARWQSERLGAVRPDIFIRAAERSGLISDITLILLRKALVAVHDWPADMRVSFNLSARDLHSLPAIARICDTVRESGVDPKRIEFEITETAMLTDFDQALEALALLKGMGSRIALDDFGSGYSSFGYIHRLPVDKIKIDRSFVTQLLRHDSTVKIIKTLIDLCENLSLEHVIEGVETAAELRRLKDIGARYIQGYYFSEPMRADTIAAYLSAETWREGLKEAS
ncbi:bifunctional diguanylate cyclase/phosphodiesterase [Asticcacaulis sp. AND118]|uniref:putative bifunctional diguanylate cyclase/phosphodiesterase n=1 Tax=Asticcacaulis sp. AND118 TaxID=2840468 RepID=UPI001CFFA5B0|nr:EAL domain-containing protein [Asticcacaulis sp. AND118]UDF04525.1 EAL domain-containing protein [Asticcacaulis sp. AND118]